MNITCEKIPYKDKGCHAIVMFIITLIMLIAITSSSLVLVLAALISVAKELYDLKIKKTKFDFKDIFADAIGIVFAVFVYGFYTLYIL